jgi:hypothetical protein
MDGGIGEEIPIVTCAWLPKRMLSILVPQFGVLAWRAGFQMLHILPSHRSFHVSSYCRHAVFCQHRKNEEMHMLGHDHVSPNLESPLSPRPVQMIDQHPAGNVVF